MNTKNENNCEYADQTVLDRSAIIRVRTCIIIGHIPLVLWLSYNDLHSQLTDDVYLI
jgi:hypothetical protein